MNGKKTLLNSYQKILGNKQLYTTHHININMLACMNHVNVEAEQCAIDNTMLV